MGITVYIRPEVEAALSRRATALGCAVEDLAATLLEEAVDILPIRIETPLDQRKRDGERNLAEVCAMVRGLTDNLEFSRDPSIDRLVDLS